VIAELVRIVRVGGGIAILHPDDDVFQAALRSTAGLRVDERTRVRTLGRDAVIWSLLRK